VADKETPPTDPSTPTAEEAVPQTDSPNQNGAPTNGAGEPAATADFQALMEMLVPPMSITVVDIFGETYEVPSAIPARAQIKVIRRLESIKSLPVASQINLEGGLNGPAIAKLILTLAQDPRVMAALAESFELAHPAPFAATKKRAETEGTPFEDAADLFPIEEIVGALVPLFVRLAQKAGAAVRGLGEVTNQMV